MVLSQHTSPTSNLGSSIERSRAAAAADSRNLVDDLIDAPQRGDAHGLRVPYNRVYVPVVRRVLSSRLKALDVDATTISEVAIVVSELLANAMQHAAPADSGILLRWQIRQETVDLEVTDGGPRPGREAPVHPRRPGVYATNGRGLRIVRNLAHEWGVIEHSSGGRTVWAALGGPSHRRHSLA